MVSKESGVKESASWLLSPSARARKDNERAADKFYTNPKVALDLCVNSLLPWLFENKKLRLEKIKFVEPSAGSGAFLDALPKR